MLGKQTTKRREFNTQKGKSSNSLYSSTTGVWSPRVSHVASYPGTQVTVSEGHSWPPPRGAAMSDRGGDFFTQKSYVGPLFEHDIDVKDIYAPPQYQIFRHKGIALAANPSVGGVVQFPPASNTSDAGLDALGATAIARCAPTNSVADVATFLGELYKDKIPHLVGSSTWRDRTSRARGAADDYLNLQFGWAPLVSDVKDFANAVNQADAVMKQYRRDSGRVVRRTYHFPREETVSTVQTSGGFFPYGLTDGEVMATGAASGPQYRERRIVRNQWFSGAFTYYIPPDKDGPDGLGHYASLADKLFGISLNPDVLWELAPWSWAVDWFSNTGDVIHNLSSFGKNGLVLRYGYIMETVVVTDTYTLPTVRFKDGQKIAPLKLVTVTKKRRRANPFGFGVSWDAMSTFQLSILAALGISRS